MWQVIQRESWLWCKTKPLWRLCARIYLRFSALKVRNALVRWNKTTKPGTIAHHQLFHSFFARTGKNPEQHVAGADCQEGKAQKSPLVVCFYQRIPQFDTSWKNEANTDHIVKGYHWRRDGNLCQRTARRGRRRRKRLINGMEATEGEEKEAMKAAWSHYDRKKRKK